MSLNLTLPGWLTVALFAAAPPTTLVVTAPTGWTLACPGRRVALPPRVPVALQSVPGGVRARWPGGAATAAEWFAQGEGPWALRAGNRVRRVAGRWRCERVGGALRTRAALPLEAWVAGALAAEWPPDAPLAAGEAQATCVRTFAAAAARRPRHRDAQLCDATHCLRFAPSAREPHSLRAAREGTQGRCLTWEGKPALTVWHAACGGWLADAAVAFGGEPVPYLRGGPDRRPDGTPWCEPRPWRVTLPATRISRDLSAAGLWPRGARVATLSVESPGAGAHVERVRVAGDTARDVSGVKFWQALGPGLGWKGLRSLRFTLSPGADGWVARGVGLGHGAGLCQAGAIRRASAGSSMADILQAYYPGTRLLPSRPEAGPAPW